ncbi:hypothetical protein [Burkholderia multivorans]|nr:hypothetical protein [Burkholderia multivorans]
MNHTDFHIGLTFMDCTGWWRCTDVGARTILAILRISANVISDFG